MDLQPNKETLAGCRVEFNAAPKYRQVTATTRCVSILYPTAIVDCLNRACYIMVTVSWQKMFASEYPET
jgi:hypothetical protein